MCEARKLFPLQLRESQQHVAELKSAVLLIVNLHQNGMVHRLSSASRFLPRDKKRSCCGWRGGRAVSHARFCATKVWPPPGMVGRICIKCFPTKPTTLPQGREADDIEHEEDAVA